MDNWRRCPRLSPGCTPSVRLIAASAATGARIAGSLACAVNREATILGKTPLSGGSGAANGAALLASETMTAPSGPPPVRHIDGVGESLNDGIPSHTGDSGTQRIWLPAVPTRNVSHPPLGDMSTRNSVVTVEAVTQQIIDFVGKDLGAVDLTADSSLQSQALDSLEVMVLVFKIEEHYEISLDEEDADDLRTVGDLAALVVRRIEQQR
jgi:acyl carrier protein